MSDNLEFSEEELEKIIEWFNAQPSITDKCPTCGYSPLKLGDKQYPMRELVKSDKGILLCVIYCENCGYTRFHNLATLRKKIAKRGGDK